MMDDQSLNSRVRAHRTELVKKQVEEVALRLFEERGFTAVTVDDIVAEAQISARTFYRYFPTKEDVLQIRIDRRSRALKRLLEACPPHEPPLESLRHAIIVEIAEEDEVVLRRWISVIASTPIVLRGVLGGIQLKPNRVMADFLASRLGRSSESLVPAMLAAAVGGIIQAALTNWYVAGGDLVETISEGLAVFEQVVDVELEE